MTVSRLGVLITAIALALFAGCGGHDGGHDGAHDATHDGDHAAVPDADVAGADAHGLVLNGSDRWRMDDHTRTMFAAMAARFEGVDPAGASADELRATGAALAEDIGGLIAGCTMTGAAHDVLHDFLVLYMPAVDALAETGGTAEAERVQELLRLYPRYFE